MGNRQEFISSITLLGSLFILDILGVLMGIKLIFFKPYPSGLLHWHSDNHMIAPVPVK